MLSLRLSSIILLLCGLSACSFKSLEFKKFDIKRVAREDGQNHFEGFLIIQNPNSFGLRIKSADLQLTNPPITLGNAKLMERSVLPAKKAGLASFELAVDNKALLLGGLSQLGKIFGGQGVNIKVQGQLKACTLGIFCKRYQVNEEIKISL